jgi:flagellar motility protein MotE (MotC chaperone)
MLVRLAVITAAALLAIAPGARAGDQAMQSALDELQAAHRHLKQAEKDYDGHRRAAIDRVEKAIEEVKQGLAVAERHDDRQEKKLDKREGQLQQKDQRIERKLDKVQNRREQLGD